MKKSLSQIIFCCAFIVFFCSATNSVSLGKNSSLITIQGIDAENNSVDSISKEQSIDSCEVLSLERDFSVVGKAASFEFGRAKNNAIMDARRNLVRMTQTVIGNIIDNYINIAGRSKTIDQNINDVIPDINIVKSACYILPDGLKQYSVCIEIANSEEYLEKIIEKLEKEFADMNVEFDKVKFRGDIKRGLLKYKEELLLKSKRVL